MLTPAFAGELFGPGQPLDATQILHHPARRASAHGKSSKPSDGLRAKFPRYNYDDMVAAQYRLVTEGLGIRHLRLVIGNSMGGMHTWIWGATYPDFMDALVPMASQPTAMSSRNWMMRRMIIDAIRNDPGLERRQLHRRSRARSAPPTCSSASPPAAARWPTRSWRRRASRPTSCSMTRLAAPFTADANDFLYQWDSSRDYDPSPGLERSRRRCSRSTRPTTSAIRRRPGSWSSELKRVKNGQLYLIPASEDTRGHGTTGMAKFWKQQLQELLQTAPKRTM